MQNFDSCVLYKHGQVVCCRNGALKLWVCICGHGHVGTNDEFNPHLELG